MVPVIAILFALGAVVGSFLNVVIYRTVHGKSWVWGRSQCEHCGKVVRWYDNIPLLSYMLLGGKCRYCRKPIGFVHPAVEFLIASLFVWWYLAGFWFFQLTQRPLQAVQPVFWLVVGIILIVIVVIDSLYYIIPDLVVALLFIATLLYRLVLVWFGAMQVADFGWAVLGAVCLATFFGLLWFVTKGKGLGLGDVKVAAPLALLVGWPNVFVMTLLAFCIGAICGILLLLSKRRKPWQVIPFGPFLVLATCITLIWGDQLLHWYMQQLLLR